MNPKASKREAISAFIISFFIAVILTSVIFSDSESEFPTTFFFLVIPTAIIVLVFIATRLSGRSKERVNKQFQIFAYLDLVAHELIANRISLIIILFLFALFFGMGQAEELLLHLADTSVAPPFFFGVLLLLALLSWYWTRFMYLQNIQRFKVKDLFRADFKEHLNDDNPDVVHIRGILPKLLGLIIILIPTFFMLKLYMNNVPNGRGVLVIASTLIMFWILAIIIYAFSKVSFYHIIKTWITGHKGVIIILILVFAALTAVLFFSQNMNSPKKIPLLYMSGLVVAIFYFLISSMGIEKMFFVSQTAPKNRISRIVFFGAILFSIIFIAFNAVPLFFNINGLTILLCGLVFYSFLSYFFIILGGKIKVPILTLLFIIGATISIKFSPSSGLHDIRLVESVYDVDERVSINTYVAEWFKTNAANIKEYKDEGKPFPIVFVSSEGGGSRAALWTLLSHDALETRVDDYYDHLFSMSGASGGNTGNSFYMAFQEIRNDTTPVRIRDMADRVFINDFVSTDVGMLFGRDTWQSIFYSSFFDDRSEILQQKWENTFEQADLYGYSEEANPLQSDFLSFWYDSGGDMANSLSFEHPLFLLSTTHVQSGDHATLSAVKLYDFIPQNMDVLDEVSEKHGGKSIPLSSGALMNARFPIVCPSGKIDQVGNFVDAGYSDNTGGVETRAAILAVIKYLNQPGDSLFRSDFNLVHIAFRNGLPNDDLGQYVSVRTNRTNSEGDTLKQEPYKIYEAPAEPGVPIVGLAGAAFAHPNRELAEIQFIVDTTLYFDLARTPIVLDTTEKDTILPILPLSRHLSNLAILSMHARMRIIMNKDAGMVKGLKHIFDLKKPDNQ